MVDYSGKSESLREGDRMQIEKKRFKLYKQSDNGWLGVLPFFYL